MTVPRLIPLVATLLAAATTTLAAESDPSPASGFDLKHWKLQIPGPKDVRDLHGYSSPYFRLNEQREMWFHVDAADKGPTPNTKYVRSELRHLPDWRATEAHTMSAELRVASRLTPDRVTVLQIHGITKEKGNAPPLLRVAVHDGDLVAVIKTTSDGDQNDTVVLKKGLGTASVKVKVAVGGNRLKISVDGQQKVDRSLGFWKHRNFFKAGAYPQATTGTVDVFFRELKAE